MSAESICEYLEWDSQFFGQRIARVKISRLTEEQVEEIDDWCSANEIDCLYFMADSSDQRTARLAQDNHFRFVDVRVTLELPKGTSCQPDVAHLPVRTAVESDIPALRALARNSHRDSRFYYDGHFPQNLCDQLYEIWIEKSCRGWANHVLVAGEDGKVEGYVTCHLQDRGCGQIGLLGVGEHAQGKGLGKDLLSQAVQWFAQQGVEKISVVTQGRNVRAQRFYQRCGFITQSVDLWFHRWFSETRASS
jgi:dTDP-4-amino-4,6-dideoxy-D-galactose acyltransferase